MKRIQLLILSIVFSFSALNVFSQKEAPLRFTLKEAQDYAVQNSYKTRSSSFDVEIAKKQVKNYTSVGLPQINASGKLMDYLDIPTTLIPGEMFGMPGQMLPVKFGSNYTMSGSIDASQLIFDGTYIIGLKTARIYVQMTKTAYLKSQQEIRETVTQAYTLILVAKANRELLDSTITNMRKMQKQTNAYQQNGFVDSTEVDQITLLLSNLENKLSMVDRQIDMALDMLKFQMGIDINQNILLTDNLKTQLNDAFAAHLSEKLFDPQNHIDYQLLKTSNLISSMQYKMDKYKYLPSLVAIGSISYNAQRNKFDFLKSGDAYPWYRTSIIGLSLSVPIWSSGTRYYKLQMDKYTQKKNELLLDQAAQGLLLEVQNAKSTFKTYADQYQNDIKSLELARRIYEKMQVKYREGVATSLELTQAHNQYLTAEGNYFNTILELLNANSKLNKALNNY